MDELIPLVNQLQEILNSIQSQGIHLPQIVVVGSQSTGKSSVLENLVGRDFLPRGSDIVTRRPLILQLVHVDQKNDPKRPPEWGVFGHAPEKIITDFDRFREEIERVTNQTAGTHKNVSNDPIFLKIYSPHVLHLTLIDLPGLTKVPVGDQPDDIEERIRAILLQYIRNPNSIILAVSSANVDLANSEALKLAKQVDPEGHRTIGVLTKLDLMDRGTHAAEILAGKMVPLKLGYYALVNRSQKDIRDGITIEASLRNEERFFRENNEYFRVLHRCGTRNLSLALNKILTLHIRDCLPEIKTQLDQRLLQTQKEMLTLGDFGGMMDAHKGSLLLRLLTSFASDFKASIDGNNTHLSTTELYGGARIRYIFHDVFSKTLEDMEACNGLSAQDIRTAIRNSSGPRTSLFVPETAFDLLSKRQIQRLLAPSARCVELVFDELTSIISLSIKKELFRFPQLARAVNDYTCALLRRRLMPTREMVENLISIELAYINTNHPDFYAAATAMQSFDRSAALQQMKKSERTDKSDKASSFWGVNNSNNSNRNHNNHNKENERRENSHVNGNDVMLPAAAFLNNSEGMADGERSREGGFFSYLFGHSNGTSSVRKKSPEKERIRKTSHKDKEEPRDYSSRDNLSRGTNKDARELRDVNRMIPAGFSVNENPSFTAREEMETTLLQSLITAYFSIIRKNVQDTVPKAIMHFLVNQIKDALQDELIKELYKETLFDGLLAEDPTIAKKRDECLRQLRQFQRASNVLTELRDRDLTKG